MNRKAGISREINNQAGFKKQKVIAQQETRKSSFVEKHSQIQTQSTKRESEGGRERKADTGREHGAHHWEYNMKQTDRQSESESELSEG